MAAPGGYNVFLQRAASAYGTDIGVLDKIAELESGRRAVAKNDWDSNAKAGHPSEGMFQFIPSTFEWFAPLARKANPKAWAGVPMDFRDWRAQALATSWAVANGKGSHWATYDRAKAAAGGAVSAEEGGSGGEPASGLAEGSEPLSVSRGGVFDAKQKDVLESMFGDSKIMNHAFGLLDSTRQNKTGGGMAAEGGGGADLSAAESVASLEVLPRRSGEANWQYLQRLGQTMFGLQNDPGDSQTTGGGHRRNSRHYSGNAIDFGDARNSRPALNKWMAFLQANREKLGIKELLDEGDHIHAAL